MQPEDKTRLSLSLAITLFITAMALALWAFMLEPNSLRTRDHYTTLGHWPKECPGLKVAVLADLHVGSPFNGLDKLGQIVESTNLKSPDLILLPGDFIIQGVLGGEPVSMAEISAVLAQLKAPLGVYAVLGNHDWWGDGPQIIQALEGVGIPVLEDRNLRVGEGACAFYLAGISDYWEGAHDIDAALQGINPGQPTLAFTHNPDVFPEMPVGVDLLIAGHTHGGQVYFPWLGRLVVPSKYGERYAVGLIEEGGKKLFVSTGLGTSILPVRFLVPPEISLLHLSPCVGEDCP